MAKEVMFTVDGIVQKIKAESILEVYDNGDDSVVSKWNSGSYFISSNRTKDEWTHRQIFNKEGTLEKEIQRTLNADGNLVSLYEDDKTNDTSRKTVLEYDDKGCFVYIKTESSRPDGTTDVNERWFKNFYNGNKIDESNLNFDKDITYREIDDQGRCTRFINSFAEGVTEYLEDGNNVFSIYKDGKLSSRNTGYKSDDGLVVINKDENFENNFVHYEIKDNRKSEDDKKLYTVYMYSYKPGSDKTEADSEENLTDEGELDSYNDKIISASQKRVTHLMLERFRIIHNTIKSGTFPNTEKLRQACCDQLGLGDKLSIATVSRDLEFLRNSMSAPIMFDRKQNGYYYSQNFELKF